MTTFAAMAFEPGTFAAWIAVGLIAGWLASLVTESTYGFTGDLFLGSIGALVGGFMYGFWGSTFWVGILVAFMSACVLIAGARVVAAFRGA